jgi:hypothetical protein
VLAEANQIEIVTNLKPGVCFGFCVCLSMPEANEAGLFQSLAQADQFNIHLWDIKPLCHVVGIADGDHTVHRWPESVMYLRADLISLPHCPWPHTNDNTFTSSK